jgi:hypothetical protein
MLPAVTHRFAGRRGDPSRSTDAGGGDRAGGRGLGDGGAPRHSGRGRDKRRRSRGDSGPGISTALRALRPEPQRSVGVLDQIWIASGAGEPARPLETVRALAGQGLEGDRHTFGMGTFPSGLSGSALTPIEAEVCESFDPPLTAHEHRRNLVTRGIELKRLVGGEFTIANLHCRGVRLCEPCTVVDGHASRVILRALVHRGGLRADILEDGRLQVGDQITAIANY